MERYHILKLGLAITFYAVYCIRPMLVYSLHTDNDIDNSEFTQYFQGVDGRPGVDFPIYATIPRTTFSCRGIESGYYADLETNCQVFHICEDSRKISFLCPNGTIFQQAELICEWWNKVNCSNSPNLYEESAERLQADIARRKAARRVGNRVNNFGAVMRMTSRSSYSSSSTRRIPENNDIEQHIEESNNRHLANAQRSKQKKDIETNTGNYFNYEQKKKTQSKTSEHTIKEYHVQFSNSKESSEKTTTVKPQTKKYAYGTTVKERFSSFEGKQNFRGNTKYVITTYAPPSKFSKKETDKYILPPFPKHKSESSEENQVPQESSSFVKSPFNSIPTSTPKYYSNHRTTYSDLKDLSYLDPPKVSSINTITPHLVTTQPINNGKPFVGSRVGTTVHPNKPTTQSKYTYLPTSTKPTIIFGVIRHTTPSSKFGDKLPLQENQEPVNEPPFVKKFVPPLYEQSTPSSTQRNTPYSPTVPTVTSNPVTTARSRNQGVPIKFPKGQDRVSVHLSMNFGGQNNNLVTSNEYVRINAVGRITNSTPKSVTAKPRPFSKSTYGSTEESLIHDTTTFPKYQISSARPFGFSETTSPTPYYTSTTESNVYNNIDNMIGILEEIANFNSEKEAEELTIPPSVSPQTLHSLAQYFANELEKNSTQNNSLTPESKDRLTTLLTAMTVHGYNKLFTDKTTTIAPNESTTEVNQESSGTDNRFGESDNKDGAVESELVTTTTGPELRELARNFSLALSSYLNNPEKFRKNLESLRPTEPPPLDGSDNIELSTTEDELLNFSDADVRPSTPAVPSATWGYILAEEADKLIEDEVKNSLNPDLHTADSQSFVPRFNNLQFNEKDGRGKSTELPPNHWTTSTKATKLWQQALSINPAVLNDEFETTTLNYQDVTYDLRELPPLALNSTQVHGILIDFMNHSSHDENSRLNRILRKLNTSETEFLDRMKEIESSPLTKRLILLLISECGANISQKDVENKELLAPTAQKLRMEKEEKTNHPFKRLVNSDLGEDGEDTRALQLLNSLYTIASKFGKR